MVTSHARPSDDLYDTLSPFKLFEPLPAIRIKSDMDLHRYLRVPSSAPD